MKKTIFLFLILTMLLACFVSCSTQNKKNGDDKTTPKDENTPIDDLFLYVPSTTYESKLTPEFEYAFDYGVEAGSVFSDYVVVDELVGKEIIPFNNGKIFVYDRTIFGFKNIQQNEYGTVVNYDEYLEKDAAHGDREIIRYFHGTDILVYYSIPEPTDALFVAMTIPKDELKKIATDFVLTMMSEENFSEYNDGEVTIYTSMIGLAKVVYPRYINGYRTSDAIVVMLDSNGKVLIYRIDQRDRYDQSKLTKEKLDTAYEKLKNKIEGMGLPNLSLEAPRIVISSTGEPFMSIGLRYDFEEGFSVPEAIYVNIH